MSALWAWLRRHLGREPLDNIQTLPRPPERLRHAVDTCGYSCLLCQSPVIALHWAPALGWIPTIRHWELDDGWCAVLGSPELLEIESLELLDALARVIFVADYGEPIWHARELVPA